MKKVKSILVILVLALNVLAFVGPQAKTAETCTSGFFFNWFSGCKTGGTTCSRSGPRPP